MLVCDLREPDSEFTKKDVSLEDVSSIDHLDVILSKNLIYIFEKSG
jgi:hypothetical protein